MSFECFPPKKEALFDSVKKSIEEVSALQPSFVSVTYGAGGGTSRYTLEMVSNIMEKYSLPTVAHLTCVSSSRETVLERLSELKAKGVENIMALRGDLTPELLDSDRSKWDFRYASDLISLIKENAYDFCIGGGCYPEVHPESSNAAEDLKNLHNKVDAGCDFLTTQMFFDNGLYYDFVDRAQAEGINVPIIPGILPITRTVQIKRSIEISGSFVPKTLLDIGNRYEDDPESMFKAGVEFAIKQVADLYDQGVKNVHIYTMNKPEVAREIKDTFFA